MPVIYRCRFRTAEFTDACFAHHGISMPAELGRAVSKRKAEYLAGRFAARQVLEHLGHSHFELHSGADRIPLWPDSTRGSISHASNTAICAALECRNETQSLGIDVEDYIQADDDGGIARLVITLAERELLRRLSLPPLQALTLVFSAKESLFKAINPLTGVFFDFQAANIVSIDETEKSFTVELLSNVGKYFVRGWTVTGVYLESDSQITTIVAI